MYILLGFPKTAKLYITEPSELNQLSEGDIDQVVDDMVITFAQSIVELPNVIL